MNCVSSLFTVHNFSIAAANFHFIRLAFAIKTVRRGNHLMVRVSILLTSAKRQWQSINYAIILFETMRICFRYAASLYLDVWFLWFRTIDEHYCIFFFISLFPSLCLSFYFIFILISLSVSLSLTLSLSLLFSCKLHVCIEPGMYLNHFKKSA